MGAALDAIRHRYGFEGCHLAGQSGGSTLVTGLAGTRHDIACAVSGSGRLVISGSGGSSKEPARTVVDPLRSVTSIAYNRAVHFFMITDSADRRVPAVQHTPFAEKLRRASRSIPHYFVAATDDFHHDVVSDPERVTAGCALGKSDAQIATAVGGLVSRNAAYDPQRRKEIALFDNTGTARASAEPRAGSPARNNGKRP
jgi:pimeloyl-ACP methyl ester carboxylesterase